MPKILKIKGDNMFAELGLMLIIIGWALLYFHLRNNKAGISLKFVGIYSLGVLFLVIDGFIAGMNRLAYLNLLSFVMAVLVFVHIWRHPVRAR